MLKPECTKCKKELKTFGGLLFSPPDIKGNVSKYHLCVECFKEIERNLLTEEIG